MADKKRAKKAGKKVAKKSVAANGRAGICAFMIDAIPTDEGKTAAAIHAKAVKKFPDRDADSLMHTLRGVFAGLNKAGLLVVEKLENQPHKVYSRRHVLYSA